MKKLLILCFAVLLAIGSLAYAGQLKTAPLKASPGLDITAYNSNSLMGQKKQLLTPAKALIVITGIGFDTFITNEAFATDAKGHVYIPVESGNSFLIEAYRTDTPEKYIVGVLPNNLPKQNLNYGSTKAINITSQTKIDIIMMKHDIK